MDLRSWIVSISTVLDLLNRHDLTDEDRERLRELLPGDPPQGSRWADPRKVIDGIFFPDPGGVPVA